MTGAVFSSGSQDGLTVKAYRADGSTMLTFDLTQNLTDGLAGFAIKCIPPKGSPYYVPNRLNFGTTYTSQTTPEPFYCPPLLDL